MSTFEVIVVYRHLAVEQESRQRLPVVQAVVDGFGDGAAVGHTLALELQPTCNSSHSGLDRSCRTSSRCSALIGLASLSILYSQAMRWMACAATSLALALTSSSNLRRACARHPVPTRPSTEITDS